MCSEPHFLAVSVFLKRNVNIYVYVCAGNGYYNDNHFATSLGFRIFIKIKKKLNCGKLCLKLIVCLYREIMERVVSLFALFASLALKCSTLRSNVQIPGIHRIIYVKLFTLKFKKFVWLNFIGSFNLKKIYVDKLNKYKDVQNSMKSGTFPIKRSKRRATRSGAFHNPEIGMCHFELAYADLALSTRHNN